MRELDAIAIFVLGAAVQALFFALASLGFLALSPPALLLLAIFEGVASILCTLVPRLLDRWAGTTSKDVPHYPLYLRRPDRRRKRP